jgi:hypothetical protein
LNGQCAYACSTVSCRPSAWFAGLRLYLSLPGQIHDRMFDVGLRELALFLLARRATLDFGWSAQMRSGGRLADALVIALCLNRLRYLKHMAQSLVFNDCGLIDLGQPVVLPARQNTAIHPEFDPRIRILPDLNISINQLAVLWRIAPSATSSLCAARAR